MSRRTRRDVPHFASIDYDPLDDLLRPTRRIGLGLDHTSIDGNCTGVRERPVITRPFCALLHLARTTSHADPKVLVVAPLSGHFTVLLRDMLSALLPEHDVYVTDWIDARDVPLSAGPFGFEDNVDYVIDFVRALGPGLHLIGLCQSVIPVLAAVALLADTDDPAQPASMTLIAGPVDPRRNPTRVDRLLAERPITWFERATIAAIPERYPGAGRRVYPALIQRAGLMMHLARHVGSSGELFQKLIADDGEDPAHWPFHALYTAVMDLPAEFFIDQVKTVFKQRSLPRGRLLWRGTLVRPEAIRRTALITIEGEFDDIAAPGQTSAAHDLCATIPTGRRRRYVQAGVGHFGTFHGRMWRTRIMPLVRDAIHAF